MILSVVAPCPSCRAVINVTWKQCPSCSLPIQPHYEAKPGDHLTWRRANGVVEHGVVDFMHTDLDGRHWAFVTLSDDHWAAINLKYVPVTRKEATR